MQSLAGWVLSPRKNNNTRNSRNNNNSTPFSGWLFLYRLICAQQQCRARKIDGTSGNCVASSDYCGAQRDCDTFDSDCDCDSAYALDSLSCTYVLSLGCCDLGVESLDSNSKREVNKNPVEPCVGATASATGSGSFSSSLRSSPIHPSLHRTTLQPTVDSLSYVLALFTLSQQSWGGRTCTCVLGLVMILFALLISVMFCVPCSLV